MFEKIGHMEKWLLLNFFDQLIRLALKGFDEFFMKVSLLIKNMKGHHFYLKHLRGTPR